MRRIALFGVFVLTGCIQQPAPQQAAPDYPPPPYGAQNYAYGYGGQPPPYGAPPGQPPPQPAPPPPRRPPQGEPGEAWIGEPTSPPPAVSDGDRFAAARQRCVDQTNAYRARVGAPPLARRPDREACTDVDAAGDATRGTIHGESGHCQNMAQNECPGWPGPADRMTPACLASMFQEGPGEPYSEHGHFINMTSRAYTGLSCGFFERRDGKIWMVQNYFQ